jgi:hypothetical protein
LGGAVQLAFQAIILVVLSALELVFAGRLGRWLVDVSVDIYRPDCGGSGLAPYFSDR